MPKLQAKVPKGVPPNALLRVRLPDGTEVNVRVPEGLSEGQEFIFEVDSMEGLTTSSVKTSAAAEASVEGSNSNKQAAKKDSSLNKFSNKQAKKKNKKPTTPNRNEEAPSFVTHFFNYYKSTYEMVLNILDTRDTSTHKSQTNTRQSSKSANEFVTLLDREIVTGADFCVALSVGIFIGVSIVLGFIYGVLWVTPITDA
jgi:hypothetical protein